MQAGALYDVQFLREMCIMHYGQWAVVQALSFMKSWTQICNESCSYFKMHRIISEGVETLCFGLTRVSADIYSVELFSKTRNIEFEFNRNMRSSVVFEVQTCNMMIEEKRTPQQQMAGRNSRIRMCCLRDI